MAGVDIPEFVVSTLNGKILQLHKNLATGTAVVAANLVASAMGKEKPVFSASNKKSREEYVFDRAGSATHDHDGTVSRPDESAETSSPRPDRRTRASTIGNRPHTPHAVSTPQAASIRVISEFQYETVTSLQTHPNIPAFVIGGYTGIIQMWNYTSKNLLATRKFEIKVATKQGKGKEGKIVEVSQPLMISALNYSRNGNILAVGFTNGSIKILNGETLADYHEALSTTNAPPQPPFPYESEYTRNEAAVIGRASITVSQFEIKRFVFSDCGKYLAMADAGNGVSIVKREPIVDGNEEAAPKPKTPAPAGHSLIAKKFGKQSPEKIVPVVPKRNKKSQWVFYGRNQPHSERIVGLMFMAEPCEKSEKDSKKKAVEIEESKPPRLISVGYDRNIVEYDVASASIAGGFKVKVVQELIPEHPKN